MVVSVEADVEAAADSCNTETGRTELLLSVLPGLPPCYIKPLRSGSHTAKCGKSAWHSSVVRTRMFPTSSAVGCPANAAEATVAGWVASVQNHRRRLSSVVNFILKTIAETIPAKPEWTVSPLSTTHRTEDNKDRTYLGLSPPFRMCHRPFCNALGGILLGNSDMCWKRGIIDRYLTLSFTTTRRAYEEIPPQWK